MARIAKDLNVSEDEVISMNRRMSGGDSSLNAQIKGDGDGTAEWQDWLEDEDADQAMAYANGTPYGLSSAIYTENRQWAERFKVEIKAGMSSINNSTVGAEAHMPFGGNGWSGNGTRESGVWVLDAYTKWHAVNDDWSGHLQLAQIDTDYGKKASYDLTNWDHL